MHRPRLLPEAVERGEKVPSWCMDHVIPPRGRPGGIAASHLSAPRAVHCVLAPHVKGSCCSHGCWCVQIGVWRWGCLFFRRVKEKRCAGHLVIRHGLGNGSCREARMRVLHSECQPRLLPWVAPRAALLHAMSRETQRRTQSVDTETGGRAREEGQRPASVR